MRAALALASVFVLALLGGCVQDEPAPAAPPRTPEGACGARGLTGPACGSYCAMSAQTCGVAPPPAMPYPTMLPTSMPVDVPSAPMPPLGNATPPVLPDGCAAAVPDLALCPEV